MDKEFLARLLKTFKIEAEEHIKNISEGLLDFEKKSEAEEKKELINFIFREAHSLKGAARAVNLTDIEGYCQALEGVFARLRDGQLSTSFKLIDDIHKGIDLISTYLNEPEEIKKIHLANELDALSEALLITSNEDKNGSKTSPKTTPAKKNKETIINVNEEKQATPITPIENKSIKSTPEKTDIALQDTIRVSTKKLDTLFLKSEEMLSAKLTIDELQNKINSIEVNFEKNFKTWDELREVVFRKREEINLQRAEELIEIYQKEKEELFIQLHRSVKSTKHSTRIFSNMVSSLVDEMKEVLMLPFSYLSDPFPKMIRELARDLNKEIEFELVGSNIEIDRRILEEMKDAMIHLLRNSVDHGIELPEERESKDKSRIGKISLTVSKQSGDKIAIILKDDGAGINYDKLRAAAVSKQIYRPDEINQVSEEHLLELIFHPDFSTSKVITDISGRGVGMSVVQDKINRLSGSIKIHTSLNKGTEFRILLPLTLAKLRAVILRCADQIYALQTFNVERVFRVKNSDIHTVQNRETITFDNKPIPLCRLNNVLGISESGIIEQDYSSVVVISVADDKIAFKVDEILHEQEILIKRLNRQLSKVKYVNGVTILGNGQLVPVLNTTDLLKEAGNFGIKKTRQISYSTDKKFNLLVADDSITSRMLLRDILETAGFNTKMAVDGMHALTELKENKYDLVISDVEMPRLNGFELTKAIRTEESLKRTPVILLTALAKKEDREKGIGAGANAYIVKSGFDQSNLLETIKRLL